MAAPSAVTDEQRQDAETIWKYHRMGHEPRPVDAAIGLGSHDLGVATFAAEYPRLGFAVEQDVPASVLAAYARLIEAGFDSRLL